MIDTQFLANLLNANDGFLDIEREVIDDRLELVCKIKDLEDEIFDHRFIAVLELLERLCRTLNYLDATQKKLLINSVRIKYEETESELDEIFE